MSDPVPSLRSLFPELEARAHEPPTDRWQKFRARLDEEIKGIKWPATMPDLLPKIGELLDIKVPDILISAWKKARELQDALDRSRQSPEEKTDLELADHTLTSEHHPYIEIRVGRLIPAKRIEFTVKLTFALKAFVLHIENGTITAIKAGTCEAGGTVEFAGLTIAEKTFAPIELPQLIDLTPQKT